MPRSQRKGFYADVRELRSNIDGFSALLGVGAGTVRFVSPTGSDSADGFSRYAPYATVAAALAASDAGDLVGLLPGEYDEAVTVPRTKSNVKIVGMGGRGSVFIAPETANATAMTILADDVTIENVGMDGDGTGSGCANYGRRTRVVGCKIEGGTIGLKMTLGTVAQIAANSHGKGDDCWIIDCEIAFNTKGIELVASDYGAITQARFRDCVFHDNSDADFEESGGSVDIRYRGLDIGRCSFERLEDGTEPAKYILLNDDNGNKGKVWGCNFPTALNGGKNLVSTGLIWTGNQHTGGLSTGQPS